jgi:hypothetical protein
MQSQVKSHAFRPFIKQPVGIAYHKLKTYFEDVVVKDQKIFDIQEKWEKVLQILQNHRTFPFLRLSGGPDACPGAAEAEEQQWAAERVPEVAAD